MSDWQWRVLAGATWAIAVWLAVALIYVVLT